MTREFKMNHTCAMHVFCCCVASNFLRNFNLKQISAGHSEFVWFFIVRMMNLIVDTHGRAKPRKQDFYLVQFVRRLLIHTAQ